MMIKIFKGILSFLLLLNVVYAQDTKPPFWDDIQVFKKQDSAYFPGTNKILFVGSSSFTKWTDVQRYFPAYPIINRGFGGSSLPDVIRYADDIIFPYQPKQIVIYCGENDLAASDTVSGKMVYRRFVQLFEMIRKRMPGVPVLFISLKPSPSRWHLRDKMIRANKLIKGFLRWKHNAGFIDVYHRMLEEHGSPVPELFLQDRLHMNAMGYDIWKRAIEPHLKK